MKLGGFGKIVDYENIRLSDFDYAELDIPEIEAMTEREFCVFKDKVRETAFPVLTGARALPVAEPLFFTDHFRAIDFREYPQAKPILKWAGGKTQMLGDIMPKIPTTYGKYIEPFLGGGALFFALNPDQSVIADSNPELINMYQQVANNVDTVIGYLRQHKNINAA